MSEQSIGFKKKPIMRIGKREQKILDYLRSHLNFGERLKTIIEACEETCLSRLPQEHRKRLETYYLSSLASLRRKGLVFKQKKVETEKLFIWPEESLDFSPQHYTTVKRKVTVYGVSE